MPLLSVGATAAPKPSPLSAAPGMPDDPWNSSRSEASPVGGPLNTLTAPAPGRPLTVSPGAPTATSSPAVLSKSPVATANPKASPPSGLPWVARDPLTSPPAVPLSRLTAPASCTEPTSSPGTPTTRSATSLPARMPVATESPKLSPVSAEPAAPLPCQKVWLPAVVMPPADPKSTVTAPASTTVPMFSPGAPTARSKNPSPLKSAVASDPPKPSDDSGLDWTNSGPPPRPSSEP